MLFCTQQFSLNKDANDGDDDKYTDLEENTLLEDYQNILRRIKAVLKVMCLIPINTYIVVVFSQCPSLHVDLMQPSTMTEPSAPLGSSQCPVAAMLIARLFLRAVND